MDKTRVITSLVIGLAIIIIIIAFTPLRWLIVDAINSPDQNTTTPVINTTDSPADANDIDTLIDDIEALIDVIEVPVDDVDLPSDQALTTSDQVQTQATVSQSEVTDVRPMVLQFIEQWREARQNGDITTYLSAYSSEFVTPDQSSMDAWQSAKRSQFSSEVGAVVRLTDIAVRVFQDNSKATVSFEHEVRANDTYDWSKVELDLSLEDGQWRIVLESASD